MNADQSNLAQSDRDLVLLNGIELFLRLLDVVQTLIERLNFRNEKRVESIQQTLAKSLQVDILAVLNSRSTIQIKKTGLLSPKFCICLDQTYWFSLSVATSLSSLFENALKMPWYSYIYVERSPTNLSLICWMLSFFCAMASFFFSISYLFR